MARILTSGVCLAAFLVCGIAHATPVNVSVDTTIGDYSFVLDSGQIDNFYINGADVSLVDFTLSTGTSLYPAPPNVVVSNEMFSFNFGVNGAIPDISSYSVSGSGLEAALQNSTLFITGTTTGGSPFSSSVDFNVTSFSTSAVPLPDSLATFGGALLTLGPVAYGLRRKAKVIA